MKLTCLILDENKRHDDKNKFSKIDEEGKKILENIIYKKDNLSENDSKIFDLTILLNLRQDRLWDAIKERYNYNTSIRREQDYLCHMWIPKFHWL